MKTKIQNPAFGRDFAAYFIIYGFGASASADGIISEIT